MNIRCCIAISLLALGACSQEEPARTDSPPQESAAAPQMNETPPVEGTSFAGTPLYRNDVDPERLAELASQMRPLEAKQSLTEDEYIELARLYVGANRFRDAIDLYSRGLTEHPDSFKLRRHRGHRYINVRELENAIVDLTEAVELIGTEHADVLEYNASGEATATYEHWTWYHIGLYHYLNGDWESAAAAYRRCVDTATANPVLVGATDWLYNAYRKGGMHDEAAAAIAAIPADMDTNQEHPYFRRVMVYKGELAPTDVLDFEKPASEWNGFDNTAGYGVANWFAFNGDAETSEMIHRKILATPFWNAWAYVVTDREYSDR